MNTFVFHAYLPYMLHNKAPVLLVNIKEQNWHATLYVLYILEAVIRVHAKTIKQIDLSWSQYWQKQ